MQSSGQRIRAHQVRYDGDNSIGAGAAGRRAGAQPAGSDMAKIRVSLDAGAVPSQPTGAGRYVLSIAGALSCRDDVELVLLCRKGDSKRWQEIAPGAAVREVFPRARPVRLAWEQIRLGRMLATLDVDVHHGPHYTMPSQAAVPVVVTVHDLTFIENPQWHEPLKVAFFRRAIERAARDAASIVCVSDRTANSLKAHFSVRGPVVVAPHGIDGSIFTPKEPSSGHDGEILRALGISRSYILFLGTVEPRKSVPVLVKAFDVVSKKYPDLDLVITGKLGWDRNAVMSSLGSSVDPSKIKLTGYVTDEQLPAVLRQASLCAYPALEEGFGLPALEALACATPLVTTSKVPAAELAHGAAWIVDSGSVGEMSPAEYANRLASTICSVLDGEDERESKRKIGLAKSKEWTWQRSAGKHVEAYRLALEAGRTGAGRKANGRRR
ncbi:MAG: glycosyltransferase family 4 protein [Acidimicrobiales bacterium]